MYQRSIVLQYHTISREDGSNLECPSLIVLCMYPRSQRQFSDKDLSGFRKQHRSLSTDHLSLHTLSTVKHKFHWDQFPRNFLADLLATSPDHLDMSRWSESRQLPRNFLVTSWRHARLNICYGEVTGKLVPVEFEL